MANYYTAEQLQNIYGANIAATAASQALFNADNLAPLSYEDIQSTAQAPSVLPAQKQSLSGGISSLGLEPSNLGLEPSNLGLGPSNLGLGITGTNFSGINPSVNVSTPMGDLNISLADVATSAAISAVTGVPGLGMVANAIGNAFGPSTGTSFGVGEQTGSGISSGQVAGYGTTTGGPTGLGINAYGQAVDPSAEATSETSASVAEAAAQAQAEAQAAATADAMGMGGEPGTGEGPGEAGAAASAGMGMMAQGGLVGAAGGFADGGIMQLGGYSVDQRPGAETSNFYLRTPEQGIDFGSFGGDKNLLNLTGNYGESTSEVTPEALGIPQEAIDYFRLKNQKQESTDYNVGIRAMFPDGVVPDFMDRVLRPEYVNASFGQSESTFQNVQGDTFTNSDRRRGIGGQGQILRGMFGNDAPTVGVQYYEPDKFDKQISGNVNFPVGKGNLDLSAVKFINEGRDNSESFKAGFNYPVGPGTISAEGELYRDQETGQDENRFGARFRVPLN